MLSKKVLNAICYIANDFENDIIDFKNDSAYTREFKELAIIWEFIRQQKKDK